MKPVTTWIMIADGNSAKIYEHTMVGQGIRLIPGKNFSAPEKKTFTDKQGRSFDSVGAARHKHEPHSTEDNRFAKILAEDLEKSAKQNLFDRLVICASPETLGHLRPHFGNAILDKVHSEIPKNLVNTAESKLPKLLENILPV